MAKIRQEFKEYLISLGFKENAISEAWENTLKKYPEGDMVTEVFTRDLLVKESMTVRCALCNEPITDKNIAYHRLQFCKNLGVQIRDLTESHHKLYTQLQALKFERQNILTIVEMIRYYWYEKGFFNEELFNEAMNYLMKGLNPFPQMRAKLDQWIEENQRDYFLQHDVFRFSLIADSTVSNPIKKE